MNVLLAFIIAICGPKVSDRSGYATDSILKQLSGSCPKTLSCNVVTNKKETIVTCEKENE